MKIFGMTIATLAVCLAAAGPLKAQPDASYPLALLPFPAAKGPPVKDCAFCHGVAAQGLATAPRLAGQRAAYLERQIEAFADHRRDNPLSQLYMWKAVAHLPPETARSLAEFFAAATPVAAADGRRELVEKGAALYRDGVPAANIVTCVVCHGPNAEGIGEIPRLGGLSFDYLRRRMTEWTQGYHPSARPMPQVARSLSAGEIDALASYLSFIDDRSAGR